MERRKNGNGNFSLREAKLKSEAAALSFLQKSKVAWESRKERERKAESEWHPRPISLSSLARRRRRRLLPLRWREDFLLLSLFLASLSFFFGWVNVRCVAEIRLLLSSSHFWAWILDFVFFSRSLSSEREGGDVENIFVFWDVFNLGRRFGWNRFFSLKGEAKGTSSRKTHRWCRLEEWGRVSKTDFLKEEFSNHFFELTPFSRLCNSLAEISKLFFRALFLGSAPKTWEEMKFSGTLFLKTFSRTFFLRAQVLPTYVRALLSL